jgi:hypothetical protein
LRTNPGETGKPGKGAPPEAVQAWNQARRAQSSARRICVEHAIAGSKHWRSVQRWTGRREDLPEDLPEMRRSGQSAR